MSTITHYHFVRQLIDELQNDGVFLTPRQFQRFSAEAYAVSEEDRDDPKTAAGAYAEIKNRLDIGRTPIQGSHSGRTPIEVIPSFADHLITHHPAE